MIKILAAWLEWLKGPRHTSIYESSNTPRIVTIESDYPNAPHQIRLQCRQILYQVVYERFWVPTEYKAVYEVVAVIPPHLTKVYDERLTIPRTYPVLVNHGLSRTIHPYNYAIKAFMDQFDV